MSRVNGTTLAIDDGIIIQVDATVIAGVLILLTISFFAPGSSTEPSFLDGIGGINGATAIIIIPFAASAIAVYRYRSIQHIFEYRQNHKPLLEKKIEKLQNELKQEKDENLKNKFKKKLNNCEKDLKNLEKKLSKHDEESFHKKQEFARWLSLFLAALGFSYLVFVVIVIALGNIE